MKIFWKILKTLLFSLIAMIIVIAIWLKTDGANSLIKHAIIDVLKNELGLIAKIDNIHISLPLIIDVDSFSVSDQEGGACSLKGLHVNILPSLFSFWEITFWSISAEELTVNKPPQIMVSHPSKEGGGFFKPDIIIRDVSIDKLTLSPAITGLKEPFSLSLNSYFEYSNSKQQLIFNTQGKLSSLKQGSFEILGSYDATGQQVDIKFAEVNSEIASAAGKLFVDRKNDLINGEINHKSNFLAQLLNPYLQEAIGSWSGGIKISGAVTAPKIIVTGSIDVESSPLSYDAQFLLSGGGIDGALKLDYEKLNATGKIAYNNSKLALSHFIAKGEDFQNTADLTLDLNSLILTGQVSVIDKNMLLVTKYLPFIHSGGMDIRAVFSSTDNTHQQLSLNGKLNAVSSDILKFDNADITLKSSDLWQGKFSDLTCLFKLLNVNDIIFDEVKIDAGLHNKDMNIKGNVISKQATPVNLNFNAMLKAGNEENIISFSKPIDFTINTISGIIGSSQIKSTNKISLTIDDKTSIKLDKLKLDDGMLSIDAIIDKGLAQSNISLKNIPIQSIISVPGHKIIGRLDGNIKMHGAMSDPNLSGRLKLTSGKYTYGPYGIKIKNISSDIIANDKLIKFSEVSAKDSFGNSLQGSGRFSITDNYDFSFNLSTPKFSPVNTPYMYGEVKGNITLNGDKTGALAKGQLTLGPFEIKIPEHFEHDIPQLNTQEDIAEAHENLYYYPLKFNIDLLTEEKVFVRGRGVDTRLTGNLKISGDTNSPSVKGILNSVRGKYQEFGKVLTIKKGELIFDGPLSPSPFLNIIGVYVAGDTEIRLILSGSIVNPYISIESTPAMSEERALSMLLFGQNTEDISTFQALQLADSARRLSGHGGGVDPLSLGRKILRVDDINFKTDKTNPENSSIGVGKYLTDKIYFEVERGRQADTSKLRVEVQITPKISIENVTKQEGSTSFGVNWRFDY